MLKLFTTTRSKATKALASVVSGAATTGVFGSKGIFSIHKGLVFVSGSRRILWLNQKLVQSTGYLFWYAGMGLGGVCLKAKV